MDDQMVMDDQMLDQDQFQSYRALYVHIPFCKKRCAYCDFTTEAIESGDPRIESYMDSLIMKIRRYSRQEILGQLETVYIGGGTPSHIGNKELSRLIYTLSLSMHLTPEVECTMEANPESLTLPMVKDIFALGVTRLSMGVQSFDNEVLQTLGRIHSASQAVEAIKTAQVRFDNISIDLMCGIPGQSHQSFVDSVSKALALEIPHISIYPLSIEEETPFEKRISQGLTEDIDPDTQASMMQEAEELLFAAGYHRYEVASYARPGHECRHNKAYWTGVPYLGIGRGAVSMKQNDHQRIRFNEEGVIETLNRPQMLVEDLFLGMRMSEGVSKEYVERIDREIEGTLDTFESLIDDNLVYEDAGRLKPTEKGWLLGNVLYGRIYSLEP